MLRKLIREEFTSLAEATIVQAKLVELFDSFKKVQANPADIKLKELKSIVTELIQTIEKYDKLNVKYKQLAGIDFSQFYKKLKADMKSTLPPTA